MSERATKRAEDLTPPRGPWACESNALEEAIALGRVRAFFWDDDDDDEPERPYEVQDGIALISLAGPMTKRRSFWSWFFGGASSEAVRDMVRQAADDPAVTGILLTVDSPGGSVDGTADLADAVAAATKRKPCHAYVSGMACSAAYWVASQAAQVTCGRTAMVGCIGTYAVLEDWSKAADQAGVKVHVVRAGDLKGMGVAGAPITKPMLEAEQRLVNGLNEHFLAAVAAGRKVALDTVREWATGETFTGDTAQRMGLVDRNGSMDDAMERLRAAVSRRSPNRGLYGAREEQMSIVERIKALVNGTDDPGTDADTTPTTATATATATATDAATGQEAAAGTEGGDVQVSAADLAAMADRLDQATQENKRLQGIVDGVTADARARATEQAVRAFGQDGAGQFAGLIAAADLEAARTLAGQYKAIADAKFGISDTAGATRTTTVQKLPDLEVHAQDVEKPATAPKVLSIDEYRELRNKRPEGA